jgi:hypothetical protein
VHDAAGLVEAHPYPATRSGVAPTNQTSAASLVVPVFPAAGTLAGRPTLRTAEPVPASTASRIRSRVR